MADVPQIALKEFFKLFVPTYVTSRSGNRARRILFSFFRYAIPAQMFIRLKKCWSFSLGRMCGFDPHRRLLGYSQLI